MQQEQQWLIQAALAEDIGRGDITSELLIPPSMTASLQMRAREELVACGLDFVAQVFYSLNNEIQCSSKVEDGQLLNAGDVLLEVNGNARAILAAERTALNFLARFCAVATLTRQYVQAVAGTNAIILDTRKTMPGFRMLDKYAVRIGGARNHRMRLDDGILIKDNHIAIYGSIAAAIQQARENAPSLVKIEVECDNLEQVAEALAAQADVILLDNMTCEQMRTAVEMVNGACKLEASGNMSLERVREVAETGVDFISVGRLTHSANNVDIGLDINLVMEN